MILIFEMDFTKRNGRRFTWRPTCSRGAWAGARTWRLAWGFWSLSYYPEPGLREFFERVPLTQWVEPPQPVPGAGEDMTVAAWMAGQGEPIDPQAAALAKEKAADDARALVIQTDEIADWQKAQQQRSLRENPPAPPAVDDVEAKP